MPNSVVGGVNNVKYGANTSLPRNTGNRLDYLLNADSWPPLWGSPPSPILRTLRSQAAIWQAEGNYVSFTKIHPHQRPPGRPGANSVLNGGSVSVDSSWGLTRLNTSQIGIQKEPTS